MDSARCQCPIDSKGTRCGRNLDCAIHGFTAGDPAIPWVLSSMDRVMLRKNWIDPEDSAEIQAVRESDEKGPGFNPPRMP